MKNIIDSQKERIGKQIRDLRKTLGLTHEHLAEATGVSTGTIVTVEAGKKGYLLDNLLILMSFFGLELKFEAGYDISKTDDQQLREQIKKYHISHDSIKYLVLEKTPGLIQVLKNRILKTDLLDTPKEVKHILQFCKTEYSLEFSSSVMANALNRLVNEKLVLRVESPNKRIFHYKKA